MLRTMLKEYKKNPKCIICNRSHLVKIRENKVLPYRMWDMYEKRKDFRKEEPNYSNFFTGNAGTLIPMFLMDKGVLDKEVFMKIAPTADDVWLNFYAWKSKIKTKNTQDILGTCIGIQDNSCPGLCYENVHLQKNDIQIKNVLDHLKINVADYLN